MVFSLSNFNDCVVFSFQNYTLKFDKRLDIVLTFTKRHTVTMGGFLIYRYIYMNTVTEK